MSTSSPTLRKKKRNWDKLSIPSRTTKTNHDTEQNNIEVRKRKTVHYRKSEPVTLVTDKAAMNTEAVENKIQDKEDGNSDENIYSTIDEGDTANTAVKVGDGMDRVYLHAVSESEEFQTEKRKDRIRRWKLDRDGKRRLLSESSTHSNQSLSDDNSDYLLVDEGDYTHVKNSDVKTELPSKKPLSKVEPVFLVIFCVCGVSLLLIGLFFISRPEATIIKGDTTNINILADVEEIRTKLKLQDTLLESLNVQMEEKNDQIKHLTMEIEKLKAIVQGLRSGSSNRFRRY